jgi:hypothetical protein
MPGGAPCPVWVMAAPVGLQQGHAKLSQAGAEPGLGPCRAATRAGSARVTASHHVTWAWGAFMPGCTPHPHGGMTTLVGLQQDRAKLG